MLDRKEIYGRFLAGDKPNKLAKDYGVTRRHMRVILDTAANSAVQSRMRCLLRICGLDPSGRAPLYVPRYYVTSDEPNNIKMEMVLDHA